MAAETRVTLYVRAGDPDCDAALRHLRSRGIEPIVRDVLSDPSASAVLFGRLGRVVVPSVQVGETLLPGYDPVALARLLPAPADEAERVSFGAAVRAVTAEVAREHGLPAAFGVEVGRVTPGSAADAAGIRPGDVIAEVGGYTLHGGSEQFRTAVAARRPGDLMMLTVWRDGQRSTVEVRFAAATPPAVPTPEPPAAD